MGNGNSIVIEKISRLKAKQKNIEAKWSKTGNPGLLQFFIDIVPELLNAERCSIFVFNPNADMLWLYCGTDLQEGQIQVPRAGSMVGEALSSGSDKIATGLEEKAGIHEIIDSSTGFTTCNTLSTPIFNTANDQVIGVLQVLNKRGAGSYSADDIALMRRLSGEINRYVESIYKHQEVAEILVKIKKRIKGLENSLARNGIKKIREEEEFISSITTQSIGNRPGRLH